MSHLRTRPCIKPIKLVEPDLSSEARNKKRLRPHSSSAAYAASSEYDRGYEDEDVGGSKNHFDSDDEKPLFRKEVQDKNEESNDTTGSQNSSGSNNENNITIKIGSGILDCPACFEPLQLPLLQCTNGHVICGQCCLQEQKKCPLCTHPISSIRCLPFESIIESNKISCPYACFGCEELITYNLKNIHEMKCSYVPCICPIPACTFKGSMQMLSSHLWSEHRATPHRCFIYLVPFKVSLNRQQILCILWGTDNRLCILVNKPITSNHSPPLGNALAIVCIRPDAARSLGLAYELEVVGDKVNKMIFKGLSENLMQLSESYFPKYFLYVPNELGGSSEVIDVRICIKGVD